MLRDVFIEEITDGRFYGPQDMVRCGGHDCAGCSACCRHTGESIILDPLDMYRLQQGTGRTFTQMIEQEIEIRLVDGWILPNIMQHDEAQPGRADACPFLGADGRCSIHPFRPGFCRLFPLGRYYFDRSAAEAANCGNAAAPAEAAAQQNGSGAAAAGAVTAASADTRRRGFHYIYQIHECTRRPADCTPVRVADWIGVPQEDLARYETFVNTWHFFLKDAAPRLRLLTDRSADQVRRFVLRLFFVQPYQVSRPFRPQFEARMARAKAALAPLIG